MQPFEIVHLSSTFVQETGIRNQDVYLTWDGMDVYFATSMRKPWEYEICSILSKT